MICVHIVLIFFCVYVYYLFVIYLTLRILSFTDKKVLNDYATLKPGKLLNVISWNIFKINVWSNLEPLDNSQPQKRLSSIQ